MDADWEVEIGGEAPVIEANWQGFIDLRSNPERVGEICEAAAFAPLTALLLALNSPHSPVWTAKCDLWEPEEAAGSSSLACYVDLLPVEGRVFAEWRQAEGFCRDYVKRLALAGPSNCSVELVIRQAIAGVLEGFAITAYISAAGTGRAAAAIALAGALAGFVDALPPSMPPETAASKLQ